MEAFLASAKLTRRPGLAEAPGTWPHAVLRVENLATYSRSRCHRCCARLATRRWPISRMLPMQSSCSLGSGMSSAGGCVATLQRPSRTAHREARGLIRHHAYPGMSFLMSHFHQPRTRGIDYCAAHFRFLNLTLRIQKFEALCGAPLGATCADLAPRTSAFTLGLGLSQSHTVVCTRTPCKIDIDDIDRLHIDNNGIYSSE